MKNKTKKCVYCKEEIPIESNYCPKCSKNLFFPIGAAIAAVLYFLLMIGSICSSLSNTNTTSKNNNIQKNNSSEKETKKKITVVDFSTMNATEYEKWCNDNKINCKIRKEFSDTVEKDQIVSQSVEAGSKVSTYSIIEIVISLGKEPTIGQRNALRKAESYSKTLHMSKNGIYKQLTSEYGEGFTAEEAQYAIDNIKADWNANALAKAKSYQETMSMSKNGIYRQLTSEYGEGFTAEEAQYAIDHLDD